MATVVVLMLLAQAINDGQPRGTAPGPSSVYVDRHVDAHIAPRDGTPAASRGERPAPESTPEPVFGTVAPADPSPPSIQLYRDRLHRDRR